MRRIYVASSWRNGAQPIVVDFLRDVGHEVYDFRHPHLGPGLRGVGFKWSSIDPEWERWSSTQFRDALTDPRARDGFVSDMMGLRWADACVLVMPSGRSAHLEAGWAAGAGKPLFILLVGEAWEPELMYGMGSLCLNLEELEAGLAAL